MAWGELAVRPYLRGRATNPTASGLDPSLDSLLAGVDLVLIGYYITLVVRLVIHVIAIRFNPVPRTYLHPARLRRPARPARKMRR